MLWGPWDTQWKEVNQLSDREPKINIREGDIESLRRKAQIEGRPVRSNTLIDKQGHKIHYQNERGKVRILGVND